MSTPFLNAFDLANPIPDAPTTKIDITITSADPRAWFEVTLDACEPNVILKIHERMMSVLPTSYTYEGSIFEPPSLNNHMIEKLLKLNVN